jgi:hypothetical protein
MAGRAATAGGPGWSGARIASRAGEGALLGTGLGAVMGGVGAVPGAVIGTATGGVFGVAEQFMNANGGSAGLLNGVLGSAGIDKGGSYTSPGKTGKPAEPKDAVKVQPVPNTNLSINLDGESIGKAVLEWMTKVGQYQTESSAPNGGAFYGP